MPLFHWIGLNQSPFDHRSDLTPKGSRHRLQSLISRRCCAEYMMFGAEVPDGRAVAGAPESIFDAGQASDVYLHDAKRGCDSRPARPAGTAVG